MSRYFVLFLFCLALNSYSQNDPKLIRKGFVFGTSLGGAITNQWFPNRTQNNADFALGLKVGYVLNSRLAVLLTSNVSGYDYAGTGRARKRDFGVLSPSIQYWMAEKIWVMGGAGLGLDAPVFFDVKPENEDETKYYPGVGLVANIGYEIFKTEMFSMNLETRLSFRNVDLQEGNSNGLSAALLLGADFN